MTKSKLIVKNSVFMAIRMFVVMAIGLYSSRVVLQQLGVTDFGIFSVIGGLTLVMTFFNSALAAAIQRYMNVELSLRGNDGMQNVFSACWVCVLLITGTFIVLAEGAGLWLINSELSIPAERMVQARIVFQMSLVIAILEILRVPYNSLIIAHEKMSFYAYNSIVEAMLKLAAVIFLELLPGDKLLVYMGLLIGVAFLINAAYVWYCRREFPALRFSVRGGRGKITEIGKFTGWNLLTSISDIAYQQGSAMVLNIFFGVTLNATMGIANQVKTAVFSFSRSVQTAANPQIVKTFSGGEHTEFTQLFMRISRISFLFVLFLGGPILMNTDFVLDIWLSVIPPEAAVFVRLMIVFCILDSLTGPLWITMQAAGKIARYQIVVSTVWLCALPLMYVAFRCGLPSYWLLIVLIGIDFALLWIRLGYTSRCCDVAMRAYLADVAWPLVCVTVSTGICMWIVLAFIDKTSAVTSPFGHFLLTSTIWCLIFPLAVYCLGITRQERIILGELRHKYLKCS